MAKRIVSITTITPSAVADTTNLVDASYPAVVQGGSGTQRVQICEVSLTGQAGASAVAIMLLSRDSQVGTGSNTRGTGQNDAPLDPATAALAAPALTGNQFATNKPQRDTANHLHNFSVNAFGGQIFWRPAMYPDQAPIVLGNTASFGEISLSAFTGSGSAALGAYIVYEPL
jgi:hypothetical protein